MARARAAVVVSILLLASGAARGTASDVPLFEGLGSLSRSVTTGSPEAQRYFVEHRGALVARRELLEQVWGYPGVLQTRTVDVHVASLRQKLERHPAKPEHIVTVHRMGYRFVG